MPAGGSFFSFLHLKVCTAAVTVLFTVGVQVDIKRTGLKNTKQLPLVES